MISVTFCMGFFRASSKYQKSTIKALGTMMKKPNLHLAAAAVTVNSMKIKVYFIFILAKPMIE